MKDQPLARLWRSRGGNAYVTFALSLRLPPTIFTSPQRHFTGAVRCREEQPAVDCVPEDCAITACSGRDKRWVIRFTTSGASLPGRSASRSQPWTEHRLIGCRGQSTGYVTTQLAVRPCAPSPLAVLPACSLASRQTMPRPPAPGFGAVAHATESAARE
jgi:hypothetical protein